MYELIHGNCIEALRQMPDRSADCIVTDFPYAVGVHYGDYQDTEDNLRVLVRDALPEMRRVARRVAITSGVRKLHLYPEPTWILCWHYFGGGPSPWGFNGWQPIVVYGTDPDFRLRMRRSDIVRASKALSEPAPINHPTPKPLGFMRKLINRVAPSPADVILDPFMGSGTTGVAAIQLGHKFIGIEINGDYLAIAKRRIAEARPDFHTTINLSEKDCRDGRH